MYPELKERSKSPGKTTFYVDAAAQEGGNDGRSAEKAWRSLAPLNQLLLQPGDTVHIAPGEYHETLMVIGHGNAEEPVTIRFGPGRYDFFPDRQLKKQFQISNTNDDPKGLKRIAVYVRDSRHVRLVGMNADLFMRGKMMEMVVENSQGVAVNGLSFDYHRPTVSEIRVETVADNHVDVSVHRDSKYRIEDGKKLVWVGEGWTYTGGLVQSVNAERTQLWRGGAPLNGVVRIEELAPGKLRLHLKGRSKIKPGMTFQFRSTGRDYSAFFLNRSKDMVFRNVNVHFMHGMGVVSQFSENLTFDGVNFAPRKGSGRVGSAWADVLHFSGCRGKILVKNVHFSGTQDDAVNVHGTHLQIRQKIDDKTIKVRFMHPQTFGFPAFFEQDKVEFINGDTLRPYAENTVRKVETINPKELLLTMTEPIPEGIRFNGDVLENATWTPDVTVRDCVVEMIPTRGFLLTTRGKILIENNRFLRTSMHAILIADDARSWYESGYVRDVTIRGNHFVYCRAPVIRIHPENREKDGPVHENIRIVGNTFLMRGGYAVKARSTDGLVFEDNIIRSPRVESGKNLVNQKSCVNVSIANNRQEPSK